VTESEYWACRVCKSINSRRSNRCYSCHTPREAAEIKPQDMPTVGEMPPVVHTGTYRPTEMRAVVVTLASVVFIMGTFVGTYLLWQVGSLRSAGERAASDDLFDTVAPLLPVLPALGVVAILAYAAWISRVVDNMPALGLGYARVSSTFAFIEPLIPGFNVYALPARLGEILGKLDPGGSGLPLLGLAWILFVGPVAVAAFLLRFSLRFESTVDFLRTSGFIIFVGYTFQAMAILIGLFLIWRVERLARMLAAAEPKEGRTTPER